MEQVDLLFVARRGPAGKKRHQGLADSIGFAAAVRLCSDNWMSRAEVRCRIGPGITCARPLDLEAHSLHPCRGAHNHQSMYVGGKKHRVPRWSMALLERLPGHLRLGRALNRLMSIAT